MVEEIDGVLFAHVEETVVLVSNLVLVGVEHMVKCGKDGSGKVAENGEVSGGD